MKVILTQDVKTLGKKGEVKEVSDGYAKNYLFRNNLAIEASTTSLNSLKISKEAEDYKRKVEKAEAVALAKRLSAATVTIALKVSENGKIFGALTSQMIADKLNEQGIQLDKRKIVLEEPIKRVGKYKITVKPYPEVSAVVEIDVVSEETTAKK